MTFYITVKPVLTYTSIKTTMSFKGTVFNVPFLAPSSVIFFLSTTSSQETLGQFQTLVGNHA